MSYIFNLSLLNAIRYNHNIGDLNVNNNIILIMPRFNGYERILEHEATKQFNHVNAIFYDEFDFFSLKKLNVFAKAFLFFFSCLVPGNPHENKLFIRVRDWFLSFHAFPKFEKWVLNKVDMDLVYDNLVVIKGYGLSKKAIQSINARKKALYQWDNLIHFPSTLSSSKSFDIIYSFDESDAKSMRWKFLPNFFISNIQESMVKSNDLFFIGVYSPLRLHILTDLTNWAKGCGYSYHFKLYSPTLQETDIITNVRVNKDEYNLVFKRSRFIVEITKSEQIGYSQRYLESLDNSSLFVVTNSSEKIYNHGHIISLSDFKLNSKIQNKALQSSPLTDSEKEMLKVCEVSNWLKLLSDSTNSTYFSEIDV